jgi:hypothetical protein
MTTVIYAIECLPTGFVYVGLSSDYRQRWRAHRVQLRRGSHTAAGMNVDWRKYGEAAFEVRVLEALPYDVETPDAQKEELRWQAHFARLGRLYNVPVCRMCLRPLDNLAGIDAPRGGRAGSPAAAGRTRGPPEESEASVDAVAASPSLLSNR